MNSVLKNILILLAFVVFVNTAKAETKEFERMFYMSLPDTAMINFSDVDKCILKYWRYCDVG